MTARVSRYDKRLHGLQSYIFTIHPFYKKYLLTPQKDGFSVSQKRVYIVLNIVNNKTEEDLSIHLWKEGPQLKRKKILVPKDNWALIHVIHQGS